jgi:membrane protein YdbS with pleckstrin-like domain
MPVSTRMLGDDEEVLVDLHPHWVLLAVPAVCSVLAVTLAVAVTIEFPAAPVGAGWLLAALVAVPLLWTAARLVRWVSVSLVVTTTRVLLRRGVFRRDVAQLRLARVSEIHTSQTLTERLLGSGRIIFDVQGDSPVVVTDVRRPRTLQRVIGARLEEMRAGGVADSFGPRPDGAGLALRPSGGGTAPDDADQRTPPQGVAVQPAAPVTRQTAAPTTRQGAVAANPSVHQQLIELDDLRQRGIVTEQEFVVKKADLLRRL